MFMVKEVDYSLNRPNVAVGRLTDADEIYLPSYARSVHLLLI